MQRTLWMDQTDLGARQLMRTTTLRTKLAGAAGGDVLADRRLGSRKTQRERRKSRMQQGGGKKSAGDDRRD